MLKLKNTIKRISILTCTFFMAISNMSLPAHAEEDIKIGKQILYSYKGYNPDGSVEDAYGDFVAKIFVNGKIAFCVQPQKELIIDANFTKSNYSTPQRELMEQIAYAGWHMSENKTDDDYAATQFMIWEAMGFKFTSNSFAGYAAKKAEILKRLEQFVELPSFDKTSLTLNVGESKTITDTNGVFENYYFTSKSDGLSVKKSGNKLTITAGANAPFTHFSCVDTHTIT